MAGDAPAFLENRDEETDWRARADSEDGKAGCENEAAAVVGDTAVTDTAVSGSAACIVERQCCGCCWW